MFIKFMQDLDYDLELERIAKEIKENKAKTVCIQLPEGLKPKATEITDFITKNTRANVFIWLESNFGSCDIPVGLEGIDLLIHFGHSSWE